MAEANLFKTKFPKDFRFPLALFLLIVYGVLAYFISRDDFYTLFSLVTFSFALTYLILERTTISFNKLIILSILFRGVFIFSVPFLSQDFFRFMWDGELIIKGLNTNAHTVDFYLETKTEQKK
jgi:hypothetical protein